MGYYAMLSVSIWMRVSVRIQPWWVPARRASSGSGDSRRPRHGSSRRDGASSQRGGSPSAHGYVTDKAKILARLKRVEGQVRAITRMVESDDYCIDVITQISASDKALKAVALKLLDDHLAHCVRHAVDHGGADADAKLHEASDAIARLVRS